MPVLTPEDLNQKLGLKTEPKRLVPLSPGAADLMPMPSNVVYPMSEREAESFSSRGVRVDPMDVGRAYEIRADRQSAPAKFANAVVGGVIGALGVALEDMSYMTLQPVGELTGALDEWEKNILAEWGEKLKEARRELFPVYKKDPNSLWNGYDMLGDLIENGLGFAIPGAALAKGSMLIGKAAGAAGKFMSRAQKVKQLSNLARAKIGEDILSGISRTVPWAANGFVMNHAEGTMMGFETYKNLVEQGYSPEEAAQRADEVRNWNRLLFLTDAYALKSVYRGIKSTRNLMENPTAWRENLKNAFTTLKAENPIFQGVIEGGEEIFQGIIQREIENRSTKEFDDSTLLGRVGKYMKDESLWYEGALGLLSGGVQSKGMEYLSTFIDNRNAAKLQKQIVGLQEQLNSSTDPEQQKILKEEIDNLMFKYETSTKKGAYEAQQLVLNSNKEFLNKNLQSLVNSEVAIREAIASGDQNGLEAMQDAAFINIVFRNAQRGTLGSLEESLQELLSKDLTPDELANMGLDANYKQTVQKHLNLLNELEKDFIEASSYLNTYEVYSTKQNIRLYNKLLNGFQERLELTKGKLEKRFKSRAPKGVTLDDVLSDNVTVPENATARQKKSIENYKNKVLASDLYEEYADLEKSEELASDTVTGLKRQYTNITSEKYQDFIKKVIEENEKKRKDAEKAAKEAKDKFDKSQQDAEAASKKQAATEEPPVATPPEVVPTPPSATPEDVEDPLSGTPASTTPTTPTSPESATPETSEPTPGETEEEFAAQTSEEEEMALPANLLHPITSTGDPITDWQNEQQEDPDESTFTEDETRPLDTADLNELSALQTVEDRTLNEKRERETNVSTGEFKVTRRTRAGVLVNGKWQNKDYNENNESTNNILDHTLAVPGTPLVFKVAPEAKQMVPTEFKGTTATPISYNEYLELVKQSKLKGSRYDFLRVPVGIYAIINGEEKLIGYLPAIDSDPAIGQEAEFESGELFKLRKLFLDDPSLVLNGEVSSREEGYIFKSDPAPGTNTHSIRNSREAIKDGTRIVVYGLNDKKYPSSGLPKNMDERYIESLKKRGARYKGATFAILPDGGLALLRNNQISPRHREMLSKAIELAIKYQVSQSKTNPYVLTAEEQDLLKQFQNLGYNLKTRKGLENFLKKYIFLKGSDKSYQVNDSDRNLYTSNLAKWALTADPANGGKSWISIEPNGIAIVNNAAVQAKTNRKIGISLGSNTDGDWFSKNINMVMGEIQTLLENVRYNTDVGSIDSEFVDVYFENGKLKSSKRAYNDHIYENSMTDVLGQNIGTAEDPKYSYRANPIVMVKVTGEKQSTVTSTQDMEAEEVTPEITNQPAAATNIPSDIEVQRDDIERRRKEELNKFKFENEGQNKDAFKSEEAEVSFSINPDGTYSVMVSLKADTSTGYLYNNILSDRTLPTREDALERLKMVLDKINEKINAKYDAELTALKETTAAVPKLSTVKIDLSTLSLEELKNVAKQLRQKAVDARQAEKQGKIILGGSNFIESDYQAVKKYIAELEALETEKTQVEEKFSDSQIQEQDDLNDRLSKFSEDEGFLDALPSSVTNVFESMFSAAIARLTQTRAIQNGIVTNLADFSREVNQITSQMKSEISSMVGKNVRLKPVAIVDANGRVIKNQRVFDLYRGLKEGFASEDVRYLLKTMPWLNNLPIVQNTTVNQIQNSESTKTICK